jgi:hypothetical protein
MITVLLPLLQVFNKQHFDFYLAVLVKQLKYSAPHSWVAPENVGLQKEQKYNTFASHTCNEMRLCQRAAKKAGLHAYRFTVVQELKQQDYDKCTTYCRWFQTFIEENPGILDYTWFSDEAWFHLSGYVNSQNTRLWGSENPHALFQEPLHSQKLGVFCALSQRRIIGPLFFDTTVRNQVYIELFREFVNQLDDQELTLGYYQQDGATSHTSGMSMAEVE